MDYMDFKQELKKSRIAYTENEPMSAHTTFKIGGNADIFVEPKNKEELKNVIKQAKAYGVPCFVLGKGSNLLVSDLGISGAVITLRKLNEITVRDNTIICEAGAHLSAVCLAALNSCLAGLEFAYGIPGSIGGALFMNAGAYGGEISQVVKGAYFIDEAGNEGFIEASDMELGYRESIFKKRNVCITEIIFDLTKGEKGKIKAKMDDLLNRRTTKQPLDFPSAGSTFKRPPDNFAGALIEKNGLKGKSVGGAMVSEKHAGFVINTGHATAKDVLGLIELIQDTVYKNDNISLQTEIIFIGR